LKKFFIAGDLRRQFRARNDNDAAMQKVLTELFAAPDYMLKKAVIEKNYRDFGILISSEANSKNGLNEALFQATIHRRISFTSALLAKGADNIQYLHGLLCVYAEDGNMKKVRSTIFGGGNPNFHGGEAFKRALLAREFDVTDYFMRSGFDITPVLNDENFTRTLWINSKHRDARKYLTSQMSKFSDFELS
jgi:hypothetical protein